MKDIVFPFIFPKVLNGKALKIMKAVPKERFEG